MTAQRDGIFLFYCVHGANVTPRSSQILKSNVKELKSFTAQTRIMMVLLVLLFNASLRQEIKFCFLYLYNDS